MHLSRQSNRRLCLLLLAVCLLCSACGLSLPGSSPGHPVSTNPDSPEKVKYTGYIYDTFDTNITLTAYCTTQEEFDGYLALAETELLRLHRLFDIYTPYPDLNNAYTVNRSAGVEPVIVDADLIELLTLSVQMYSTCDGCVNVGMGSVLRLWHDCREYSSAFPDDARLPDPDRLQEAAGHTEISGIVIDEETSTVYLPDSLQQIDLGAVAKGYAVEKTAGLLMARGCTGFAINAGGNVRVCGAKPDGTGWKVSITSPVHTAESIAAVEVTNEAVVTSGVYQRYFTVDGRKYHHIIDGTTLFPEDRYLSVTVRAESSALADALSTAFFNMDPESGRRLADSLPGVEVLWILPDQSMVYTEGFYSPCI